MHSRIGIAVGGIALMVAATSPASAADNVVADNLNSPLGFAVTDGGTLYVAEAFAGLLTKIAPNGTRTELASAPPGSGTAGVAKAADGSIYYTLTSPPERGSPPDTALAVVHPDGSRETLASLAEYEEQNNPDAGNVYGILRKGHCYDDFSALSRFLGPARYSGGVESNPYAVAAEGYDSAIVADAAGNDIVRVVGDEVSTVAVLPPIKQTLTEQAVRKEVRRINRKLERRGKDPIPRSSLDSCIGVKYASNPVPTDVEIGPDGNYYVSTLPGAPELPGYARVFKVDAGTGALSTVAKGFTGATDLAVASDGTIYVAELFAFQVSTVAPGDRSATSSTFVDCPTAVEVTSADTVYVAHGGLCGPDPGEIITLS